MTYTYISRISNSSININTTITNSNIFLTGEYYQENNYFNKYRTEILDLFEPTQDVNNKVSKLCKINNINISNVGVFY